MYKYRYFVALFCMCVQVQVHFSLHTDPMISCLSWDSLHHDSWLCVCVWHVPVFVVVCLVDSWYDTSTCNFFLCVPFEKLVTNVNPSLISLCVLFHTDVFLSACMGVCVTSCTKLL